jgi:ubiquinone/menaquinone biosynthesis C-methylase UbiE
MDCKADELVCACGARYPVDDGIPCFVPEVTYAESFGVQWNRYRTAQLDSANGTTLSAHRFWSETGWTPEWLAGKTILDVGCGAGRFAEIAARHADHVVAVDISSAIRTAKSNLGHFSNVSCVRASIAALPFPPGAFDGVYCIGVIQHTPARRASLQTLPVLLGRDGRLAVTVYERRRFTLLNGKYLVRPVTKRIPNRLLARLIHTTMPMVFPVTERLFRLPHVGRLAQFLIPVANYVHEPSLDRRQRYQWALLDTLDMLSPTYDRPMTEGEVRAALAPAVIDVRRLPNPGVNLIATRR